MMTGVAFQFSDFVETVSAQEAGPAAQEELLQRVLANPSDAELALEYATVAVANKDFEGAIGTLERLRISYPNDIGLKLELAILYFRIGSDNTAQVYLQDVIAQAGAGSAEGQTASQYLAVVEKRNQVAQWSGALLSGVRFQSNANTTTKDSNVRLGSSTVNLDDSIRGRGDVSTLLALAAHGSFDLAAQGDRLETDISLAISRFSRISRLDSISGEVSLGPSFNMKRFGFSNGRLNTYALVFGNRRDYANHEGGFGLGARVAMSPLANVDVDAKLEYRRYWYNDTASSSSLSNQNGYSIRADKTVTRRISEAFQLRGASHLEFREAKADWEQYWQLGVSGGGSYFFASPVAFLEYDWSLDLDAGYSYRAYAGADTGLNMTKSARDHEAWTYAKFSVPVRTDVLVSLSAEYRKLWSNNPLSSHDSATVMVSVAKAF